MQPFVTAQRTHACKNPTKRVGMGLTQPTYKGLNIITKTEILGYRSLKKDAELFSPRMPHDAISLRLL